MDEPLEVRRRGGGEIQPGGRDGVNKTKGLRVQRLAGKVQGGGPCRGSECGGGGRAAAQIDRIADQRMADMGQMHTYLMSSSGGKPARQGCRGRAEITNYSVIR